MSSYDGSVSLSRKLTDEETKELRITLLPYFHTAGIAELGPEDVTDFLDYAFAMISNSKPVDFVVEELKGMEMDFCPPEVADKVGQAMAEFCTRSRLHKTRTAVKMLLVTTRQMTRWSH